MVERDGSQRIVALCSNAVEAHLKKCGLDIGREDGRVPGSNRKLGPGLAEICEHCTLKRPVVGSATKTTVSDKYAHRLRIDAHANLDEDWPHERLVPEPPAKPAPKPVETADQAEMRKKWSEIRESAESVSRPRSLGRHFARGLINRTYPRLGANGP